MNYFYKLEDLTKHENYCYEKESPSTDQFSKEGTKI